MLRKICGMTQQADLDQAQALGFDFCGFIFHPQSPRYVESAKVAQLQSGPMKRVGVFCRQSVEETRAIMAEARLDFAQLHGNQTREEALALGPGHIIRVLWPMRHAGLETLQAEIDHHADACACFLVDAGKAGGGSGAHLDWRTLGKLRWPRPWFLAGGLNADCIAEAISTCNPVGIDVNSGVEKRPGIKDHEKMKTFVQNLNRGHI